MKSPLYRFGFEKSAANPAAQQAFNDDLKKREVGDQLSRWQTGATDTMTPEVHTAAVKKGMVPDPAVQQAAAKRLPSFAPKEVEGPRNPQDPVQTGTSQVSHNVNDLPQNEWSQYMATGAGGTGVTLDTAKWQALQKSNPTEAARVMEQARQYSDTARTAGKSYAASGTYDPNLRMANSILLGYDGNEQGAGVDAKKKAAADAALKASGGGQPPSTAAAPTPVEKVPAAGNVPAQVAISPGDPLGAARTVNLAPQQEAQAAAIANADVQRANNAAYGDPLRLGPAAVGIGHGFQNLWSNQSPEARASFEQNNQFTPATPNQTAKEWTHRNLRDNVFRFETLMKTEKDPEKKEQYRRQIASIISMMQQQGSSPSTLAALAARNGLSASK